MKLKLLSAIAIILLLCIAFASCDDAINNSSADAEQSGFNKIPTESSVNESKPEASVPDVSTPETSGLEKSVWYDDEELDQWFAEFKKGIDEYEPRQEISSDGMRSDHFTTIPGFFPTILVQNSIQIIFRNSALAEMLTLQHLQSITIFQRKNTLSSATPIWKNGEKLLMGKNPMAWKYIC